MKPKIYIRGQTCN